MTAIKIITIAAACFFVAVVNLATEHRFRSRIMSAFFSMAVLLGLVVYGYGYTYVAGPAPVAIMRTIMAVCKMFGGSNDLDTIASAPLFAQKWAIIIFWLAHFMAFYATAGAAVAAIGGKVLRRIRTGLLRRGTLSVIYGVNEESVEYGKRQARRMGCSVVFIGDPSLESAIDAAGGVLDKKGEHPDALLLRRWGIRPGKRRIEIAALHADGEENFAFARSLAEAFEKAGILPGQTMLVLRGVDEDHAGTLAADGNGYGYGSVMAFDEYQLASRLMVQKLPPCETMSFDGDARAQQDFGALVIGFGRMGRAALDALLMNGQFAGSAFRADIFDANAQNGALHGHELLRNYDIRFHASSGRSDALYAFLDERMNAVRYIVVCTGSAKENREIAGDIGRWLKERGAAPAIVQCSGQGLVIHRPGASDPEYQSIYGSDALDLERIDRMAMAINHAYCAGSGKTPAENWKQCDYFSRMSSRASADFYPAVMQAAGKTAEQVESGDWPPHQEALENLAITEHMRWCAFHYVMGFHPMGEAEYAQRVEAYRKDMQEKGSSTLRIGKNMAGRRHACLIPWEDLDALSRRENAVTGGHVDYKQMDRNNILALPDILAVLKGMKPE